MNFFSTTLSLLILITNCQSQQNEKKYSWLDKYISEFNRLRGFSGAVLIAKGEQVLFKKAVGWSHLSPKNKIN